MLVSSWDEFVNQFGALDAAASLAAYAVWQFSNNGGTGAWIVRLDAPDSASARASLTTGLQLEATSPGAWANGLRAELQPSASAGCSDLVLSYPDPSQASGYRTVETVADLPDEDLTRTKALIDQGSSLVMVDASPEPASPGSGVLDGGHDVDWQAGGTAFEDAILAEVGRGAGASRLDEIAPQLFNLMCIPDLVWRPLTAQKEVFTAAHKFCEARRAFLIVDLPPPAAAGSSAQFGAPELTIDDLGNDAARTALLTTWGGDFLGPDNVAAAAYYPWVEIPEPVQGSGMPPSCLVPPSGTMAGVYATTDVVRGVWKAAAGISATLAGVLGGADPTMNDNVNAALNSVGINCLRDFPVYGNVAWGARTLAGGDTFDSPFKYIPVRRLADFVEQSLQQSLKWAVLEPNGPALWATISLEANAFMAGLCAQGAFVLNTAAGAYSVACDSSTTSSADILAGIVNVNVSFAPLEPAESVVLNVTVNAGAPAA